MKFLLILPGLIAAQLAMGEEPVPENPGKEPAVKIEGVGTAVNPAGDCSFKGDARRLTIGVPGNDHALMTEQKRMTAPRVLQEITGDFTAEVKVSGAYSVGGGTVVPGRNAFQGAGLLLWVDSETYVRLERAQVDAGEDTKVVYVSWEPRVGGRALHMGNSGDGVLDADSTYFRLKRAGDEVSASVSQDGTNWREVGSAKIALPEKVQIGVVAGHNKTTGFEAEFEGFHLTKTPKQE